MRKQLRLVLEILGERVHPLDVLRYAQRVAPLDPGGLRKPLRELVERETMLFLIVAVSPTLWPIMSMKPLIIRKARWILLKITSEPYLMK